MRGVFAACIILATVSLLSAGSRAGTGTVVEDERVAIAIGQKASEEIKRKISSSESHRARNGTPACDTWSVWYDKRNHGHAFMEVEVSRLTGKASDCVIWVG